MYTNFKNPCNWTHIPFTWVRTPFKCVYRYTKRSNSYGMRRFLVEYRYTYVYVLFLDLIIRCDVLLVYRLFHKRFHFSRTEIIGQMYIIIIFRWFLSCFTPKNCCLFVMTPKWNTITVNVIKIIRYRRVDIVVVSVFFPELLGFVR